MYHRVLGDDVDASDIEPGMFVRASTFDKQLTWLRRHCVIATLGGVLASPPKAHDRPTAILTFDDGWLDNRTVAWPILERHGIKATIFLVADWVATGGNARGSCLRPDQVREMSEAGMEFGAHTASHPRLDRLDEGQIRRELRASRDAVADWTGRPCTTAAYPYGAHDERAVGVARELFQAAVVVGGGWWKQGTDPHRIPRIGIHEQMTASRPMFEARVAGLH
jgi:peptidoglycan/xylan/chitin deacetylase (PgdA/CDA1 family)